MQRRVFLWSLWLAILVGCGVFAGLTGSGKAHTPARSLTQGSVKITVTPVGPTPAMMNAVIKAIYADPTGQKLLTGNRVRQLSFEWLDPLPRSLDGDRFSVTF